MGSASTLEMNDSIAEMVAEGATTSNPEVVQWVTEVATLTQPDAIVWCDGSQDEWDRLTAEMVEAGSLIPLNKNLRPGSYLARSRKNPGAAWDEYKAARAWIEACSYRFKSDASRLADLWDPLS